MALFDFLKSKEEEAKKSEGKKEAKTEAKKEEKKEAKKAKPKQSTASSVKKEPKIEKVVPAPKKGNYVSGLILESPHVTEKATNLTAENKYVFKVYKDANKIEIKKAVESDYGVSVESVRVINVPRRKIRLGKGTGWKKGYKKAIVELRKGHSIEILPR